MINSMKYGQGKFLKLCNDTACFNDGSVNKILIFINTYFKKNVYKDINDIILENLLMKERIARLEALFSLQ